MLTEVAFNDFRQLIKRRIDHARYRVGSTYYNADISEIEITSSGIVRVKVPIYHRAAGTINQMQLICTDNTVWASKDLTIVLENEQAHFLQWFDFNIVEKEVTA